MDRTLTSKRKPYGSRLVRRRTDGVPALGKWLHDYGAGSTGRQARIAFAQRLGTSLAYLLHLVSGRRQASMEMALMIEKETHGEVTVEQLTPDADWSYVTQRSLRRAAQHLAVPVPVVPPPAPTAPIPAAKKPRGNGRARAAA